MYKQVFTYYTIIVAFLMSVNVTIFNSEKSCIFTSPNQYITGDNSQLFFQNYDIGRSFSQFLFTVISWFGDSERATPSLYLFINILLMPNQVKKGNRAKHSNSLSNSEHLQALQVENNQLRAEIASLHSSLIRSINQLSEGNKVILKMIKQNARLMDFYNPKNV